jgi:hypothetical protein
MCKKRILFGIFVVLLLLTMPVYAVTNFKISNYAGVHQIWFEAEDFDELDPADFCQVVDETGALGQAVTRGGGRGMVRWTFNIGAAGGKGGTWYFWARILNPDNRSDFMLVKGDPGDAEIPAGPPYPGGNSPPEFNDDDDRIFEESVPAWDWWGQEDGSDKVLQDGENTMYIFHRQGNASVFWDVFMWTDSPSYVPTDEDYQNAMVALPGKAFNPSPANGAIIRDTWVSLDWSPGGFAASHDVYFGENFDDVNAGAGGTFRGNQSSNHFLVGADGYPYPDGLAAGATYYWRIDGVETDGVTKHRGTVWSFFIPSSMAHNPVPPDGAKSIAGNVSLTWTAGLGAETHTVYFGEDPEAVANAVEGTPQTLSRYYPGALEFDRTYYWRVDEFDDGATHKGEVWSFTTRPAGALELPSAVSTFHCIGVYWSPQDGSSDNFSQVHYRRVGSTEWKEALSLWYDDRGVGGYSEGYRGSIVNLEPGTIFEIELRLLNTGTTETFTASTWSEDFPIAKTVYLPAGTTNQAFEITESGSPDGYILYTHPEGESSTIDVDNQEDSCIYVSASNIIIRGLTLRDASVHGIRILNNVHDVVIEGCDISGWGRLQEGEFGYNLDAAVYSNAPNIERIIVQRNKLHHPRPDTNSWKESARTIPINTYHPMGPCAIVFKPRNERAGHYVIRYNEIYSDEDHYYNDGMGETHNHSYDGFPIRDSDIYGNYIANCWDDGIEAEGANCNVRIWGNYITRTPIKIATRSVTVGPIYVWRNVFGISRAGPAPEHNYGWGAFKAGNYESWSHGKFYVFHNTILQPPSPDAGSSTGITSGSSNTLGNMFTRNNILHITTDRYNSIFNQNQNSTNDFDYDLYNGLINSYPGAEPNGINGVPIYDRYNGEGEFALDPSSPGYDAGVVIWNFNNNYNGAAPDIGAHEAGSPPMEFGVNAYQ